MLTRSRRVFVPLSVLALVGLVELFAVHGVVPSPDATIAAIGSFLGRASVWFILAISFVENLLIVNVYFPGSVVILFAMAATHGLPARAFAVFAAIVAGSCVAQHVNFLLGRKLALEKRETSLAGLVGIGLVSFWHPQIGSLASFQAGAAGAQYSVYVMALLLSWLPWNCFWGALMYLVGSVPISGKELTVLMVVYLVIWTTVELLRMRSPRAV